MNFYLKNTIKIDWNLYRNFKSFINIIQKFILFILYYFIKPDNAVQKVSFIILLFGQDTTTAQFIFIRGVFYAFRLDLFAAQYPMLSTPLWFEKKTLQVTAIYCDLTKLSLLIVLFIIRDCLFYKNCPCIYSYEHFRSVKTLHNYIHTYVFDISELFLFHYFKYCPLLLSVFQIE